MKRSLPALLSIGAALTLMACGGNDTDPPPNPGPQEGTVTPELEQIGSPTWELVDFHVFSAPIGTEETMYVEVNETLAKILPPPEHEMHPDLGIGPGAAHEPPYDTEMGANIKEAGFRESDSFTAAEAGEGNAIFATWMAVPRGDSATGSSPDFESGPIIPHSLFPIHYEGELHINGILSPDYSGDFDVPALDAIDPPFNVEGHSHFPMFHFVSNYPPADLSIAGENQWRLRMTDTSGAGWGIKMSFKAAE